MVICKKVKVMTKASSYNRLNTQRTLKSSSTSLKELLPVQGFVWVNPNSGKYSIQQCFHTKNLGQMLALADWLLSALSTISMSSWSVEETEGVSAHVLVIKDLVGEMSDRKARQFSHFLKMHSFKHDYDQHFTNPVCLRAFNNFHKAQQQLN